MGDPRSLRSGTCALELLEELFGSIQISSVQDAVYALGKAGMRSIPSLKRFPSLSFKTSPMHIWLAMVFSRPFMDDRRAELWE